MAVIDIETRDCSAPGCTEEANWRTGPYGGLCVKHAQEKKDARATAPQHAASQPPKPASRTAVVGLAGKVKQLGELGRAVDRKRETARKLAAKASAAKDEADDLEASFRDLARELMGG